MDFTCCSKFRSTRVWTNRCAARHGPSVCELEGPTPIFKMSKTEIASCDNLLNVKVEIEIWVSQAVWNG